MYRQFETPTQFANDLATHLRAFSSGALPRIAAPRRPIHLPILQDLNSDSTCGLDLKLMQQASEAAAAGRIEEAAQLFAQLSQTSLNVTALERARQFFETTGASDAALSVLQRILTLVRDRRRAAHEYVAVMEQNGWLEDLLQAMLPQIPEARRAEAEYELRTLYTGPQFRRLMIESMAEVLPLM